MNCHEQGGGKSEGEVDGKVLEASESEMRGALVGCVVTGARRKGKQLWLELESAGRAASALLIHLGMTGSCVVRGEAAPKYKSFSIDESAWPPKFCKLELTLDDGGACCYVDPRRFGRVKLRGADVEAVAPVSQLAPDALEPPPVAAVLAILAKKSAPIKAVLLDQSAVVSGVGNWVADEVLYAARLHPAVKANALDHTQVAALLDAVRRICRTACDANADSAAFPDDWLFHHRWAKQTTGAITTPIGRVHFDTIGGRTTAFLPSIQKKASGAELPVKAKPAPAQQAAKHTKSKVESKAAEPSAQPAPKRRRLTRTQPK